MFLAFIKALGLWIGIYSLMILCIVLWELTTPVAPAFVVDQILLEQKLDETVKTLQQLDDLILQYESAIQTLDSRLLEMKAIDEHAESSLNELWQRFQRQKTALEMASSVFSSSSIQARSPPPIRIKQLLQVANLEQTFPSASQVTKAFHLAVRELRQYTKKNNNHMDEWKTLAEFFRHFEYPNYHDHAFAEKQETLLEQHLQMAQERILQQFLAQRHPRPKRIQDDQIRNEDGPERNVAPEKEEESVPLSFPETWQTIRTILEDAIVNRTTAVSVAASSSQHLVFPDCIQSPNQVAAWVVAGIKAIHDQKDIRQAILHAVQEDGYDISRIILDADLSESSFLFSHNKNNICHEDEDVSSIPLRHLLDIPTLHATSAYIDAVLDIVRGYHNGLDAFLDQHVYAKVPDDVPVGRVVVAALLRAVDGIHIPQHPHKALLRWIQNYNSK
jgi:hypothetical protein